MADDFVSFVPKGRIMFIEMFLDKYVDTVQPKTEGEVQSVANRLEGDIRQLNDICARSRMKQIIVIDFDKGLLYERFNFKLTGALCKILCIKIPNHTLLESIELRNVHPMAVALWDVSKVFIPSELRNLIHVFPF